MVNELRRGNFIAFTNSAFGSGEGVVSAIQKELILTDGGSAIYPSELQQIELTDEWLLGFGFEDNLPWELDNFRLDSEGRLHIIDKARYGIIIARNVKYVHQLQNIYFSLTNTELCLK